MAGIGFELKKLFRRKGILARIVAVGYTGMVTTGPLLLGIGYLLVISWLGTASGMPYDQVNAMLAMVTYALVASQLANSVLSMVTTRYASDALYGGDRDLLTPSLVGALAVLLPVSGIVYGVFLACSGVGIELAVLNEALFLMLVAVWMQMSYLTAVKDYKGVLGSYVIAIVVSAIAAWAVCFNGGATVESLLGAVCLGYGLMMVLNMVLLGRAFPGDKALCFSWMAWIDRYPLLIVIGVATCVGLFAHLVIDWANPAVNQQAFGLFTISPAYDIPALYAVLSIIPTTITFVASTEVEFYPAYRRYFDLLNGAGSIAQIDDAQDEMLGVLRRELSRLARRQLLFTAGIIAFGTLILNMLPLGFTPFMDARFCILCVGYGAYAVGNCLSLMLMYFDSYGGAARAAVLFAACVIATSLLSLTMTPVLLGYGFALSALVYYLVSWIELRRFTEELPGSILLAQPVGATGREGLFSRMGAKLDRVPEE